MVHFLVKGLKITIVWMDPDMNDIAQKTKIIYEDAQILVCSKPAGLATQTARVGQKDLVSIMMNHVSADTEGKPYLGLINRLDQPVSGLVLFAKDPKSAASLAKEQQMHDMTKEYRTAVLGKLDVKNGYMSDYIISDSRTNTSRVTDDKEDGAKKAVLGFDVMKEMTLSETADILHVGAAAEDMAACGDDSCEHMISIIGIHLITGRHHQIRLQMSHAGLPILGDSKYGNDESRRVSASLGIKDVALCAYRLSFQHPKTHKEMEYTAEVTPILTL